MILTVNGINLNVEVVYKDTDHQEKPSLLLLHGFTGSVTTWNPFVELWSKHFQLVMVDVIGHGKSDKPDDLFHYSMEQAVNDLEMVLKQLQLDKVNVLGYSMGGRLALSFAATYPERVERLLLEGGSPGLMTEAERQIRIKSDQQLADRIEQFGIAEFIEQWEDIPLFASQKTLSHATRYAIREQRLLNNATGLSNSLRGMGTGAQPSWWGVLQQIEIPTLLITGELDQKFTNIAWEMKKKLKQSDILVIPGAGHAVHVEQPQIFGTIVLDFLKGGNRRGS